MQKIIFQWFIVSVLCLATQAKGNSGMSAFFSNLTGIKTADSKCNKLIWQIANLHAEKKAGMHVNFLKELPSALEHGGISASNAYTIKRWIITLIMKGGNEDNVLAVLANRMAVSREKEDLVLCILKGACSVNDNNHSSFMSHSSDFGEISSSAISKDGSVIDLSRIANERVSAVIMPGLARDSNRDSALWAATYYKESAHYLVGELLKSWIIKNEGHESASGSKSAAWYESYAGVKQGQAFVAGEFANALRIVTSYYVQNKSLRLMEAVEPFLESPFPTEHALANAAFEILEQNSSPEILSDLGLNKAEDVFTQAPILIEQLIN